MNEIAKALWDISTEYLNQAVGEADINKAISYTTIGELALKQAQFAVNNPELVVGLEPAIPSYLPPGVDIAMPPGPTSGPQVWGGPK